jgi:hypothetical protein
MHGGCLQYYISVSACIIGRPATSYRQWWLTGSPSCFRPPCMFGQSVSCAINSRPVPSDSGLPHHFVNPCYAGSVAPAPETPKPFYFFQPMTILVKTKPFLFFLGGFLCMTIFSILRSTHLRIFQNFTRRIMDTKKPSMNLFSVASSSVMLAYPRTRHLGPSLPPTSQHRKRVGGPSDRPLHVRRSSQGVPGKNSGSFRFQGCAAGQS